VENSNVWTVLNLGDESSLVDLGTFQDVVHGREESKTISWNVEFKLRTESNVVSAEDQLPSLWAKYPGHSAKQASTIRKSEKEGMIVDSIDYGIDELEFHYTNHNGVRVCTRREKLDEAPKEFLCMPLGVTIPTWKAYGFPVEVMTYTTNPLAFLQSAFERQFHRTFYLGPLRERPSRQYLYDGGKPWDVGRSGQHTIAAILAGAPNGKHSSNGGDEHDVTLLESVASCLKQLGIIESFSIRPVTPQSKLFQVWVKKTESASEVMITDVGFGVSQVLPVITLLYYVPEGSTVILEQPEIHLHPSVQMGLADVIINAVKTRGIQVILESHSEHLLRRLQRRIAEKTLSPQECALYFCEFKEGASHLKTLDLDEYGNIKNWPKDFFGDEFGEIAAKSKAALDRRIAGSA